MAKFKSITFGKNNITSVQRTEELDAYLRTLQGKRYEPLTIEQEIEYGTTIQNDSATTQSKERAINELVQHNIRLVVSVVKSSYDFCKGTLSTEDLIQDGTFGLHEAAQHYDPTTGFKFDTFAIGYIRKHITMSLTKYSRVVKDHHKEAPNRHTSLDSTISDDDTTPLSDILCISVDKDVNENESLQTDIMRVFNSILKPQETSVICAWFGICTEKLSRWEIAEKLGKSEERIRQIVDLAKYKIRNDINAAQLLAEYI